MNVDRHSAKLVERADTRRAETARRNIALSDQLGSEYFHTFTVGDGIEALSAALQRPVGQHESTLLLRQYRNLLHERAERQSRGNLNGRLMPLFGEEKFNTLDIRAVRDICLAYHYKKHAPTQLMRATSGRLMDEHRRSVVVMADETLHFDLLRKSVIKRELRPIIEAVAQELIHRSSFFLDTSKHEIRDLGDDFLAFFHTAGISVRTTDALTNEDQLHALERSVLRECGEIYSSSLLSQRPEADLFAASPHRNELPELLRLAKCRNDYRQSRISFLRSPSLGAWSNFTRLAEQHMLDSVLSLQSREVGITSIFLDPSSKTFGVMMHLIGFSQRRDAKREEQRRTIEAELQTISPPRKPTASGKPKKKPTKAVVAGKSLPSAETEESEREEISAHLHGHILAAAASSKQSVALEGTVAKTVHENLSMFAKIVGFNEKIARDSASILGELDLHLDTAIIECTLRRGGKDQQLQRYLSDPKLNPQGKAVILYAENYVAPVPKGVIHVRTPDALADALFALKAEQYGWDKSAALR